MLHFDLLYYLLLIANYEHDGIISSVVVKDGFKSTFEKLKKRDSTHSLFSLLSFLFQTFLFPFNRNMTDTNHTLQNDVLFAQDGNTLEEGDITEALSNIHLPRKPSPPHDERLHNNGDSESEEDLTEEHIDSNLNSPHSEGGSQAEYTTTTTSEVTNSSEEMERERTAGDNQETEGNELALEGEDNNAGTLKEPPPAAPVPQQQQAQEEQHYDTAAEDTISPLAAPPAISFSNNSSSSNSRGRSVSSVNPSTTNGLLPRSQRVWEMDRQAPECRRCHRRFNFLVRRHHCR